MQRKHLLPIVLGVALLSVSVTSVFADSFYTGTLTIGDQYSIITLHGLAQAWVNGQLLTGPANLELTVQVTFVGPHNVIFQILVGTFQIRNKDYVIDVGRWRGDYNFDTHTSVYQGPATAPDGGVGYFVIYGQDIGYGSGGVLMRVSSDFLGEYNARWDVELATVRYQIS